MKFSSIYHPKNLTKIHKASPFTAHTLSHTEPVHMISTYEPSNKIVYTWTIYTCRLQTKIIILDFASYEY